MLGGGLEAGPVVALVVHVGSIRHAGITFGLRKLDQPVVKLRLAEVAPLGRVGDVSFPLHLVGVDDPVPKSKTLGQAIGLLQLSGRQGRRGRGHRQRLGPQCLVGHHRQEGAVHAAREGNDH